ncbi:MAG: UDP-N-acetylmuramate dehydrogenase [Chloroflexi bacterium]|jgi:UDP-N-acetylmuramate dehydrogenase|nr:UDP-N-acetylmuramate dehydrogenase [Chloroflexota bacterium]BCY19187.1 UDP-N-acetylenolpyruvoylglucosamine reductase [Leptolinea sp. HRD-7]
MTQPTDLSSSIIPTLREKYGELLQENVVLANYTTAKVGGPADALIVASSSQELEDIFTTLWKLNCPVRLLASGANVLFSDAGFRGVVVLNHARNVKIDLHHETPSVWAESGANLASMARQAGLRNLTGMEWATTVPGSVGGAVYGNAGAFGSNTAASLKVAEILHPTEGKQEWPVEKLEYGYRTSWLKRNPGKVIILSARFELSSGQPEAIQAKMSEFSARRRETQPQGASMGSTFKNPEGDYAARLIEAAGLKGTRVGGAQISEKHANFFINVNNATASDYYSLIQLAKSRVSEAFGVSLELEIELVGDFSVGSQKSSGNRE